MTARLGPLRTVPEAAATAGLTKATLEADVSNTRAEQTRVLNSGCRPASKEALVAARQALDPILDTPSVANLLSGEVNLRRNRDKLVNP